MAKKRKTPVETRLYAVNQVGKKTRFIEAVSRDAAILHVVGNTISAKPAKTINALKFRDGGGAFETATRGIVTVQTDIETPPQGESQP